MWTEQRFSHVFYTRLLGLKDEFKTFRKPNMISYNDELIFLLTHIHINENRI